MSIYSTVDDFQVGKYSIYLQSLGGYNPESIIIHDNKISDSIVFNPSNIDMIENYLKEPLSQYIVKKTEFYVVSEGYGNHVVHFVYSFKSVVLFDEQSLICFNRNDFDIIIMKIRKSLDQQNKKFEEYVEKQYKEYGDDKE